MWFIVKVQYDTGIGRPLLDIMLNVLPQPRGQLAFQRRGTHDARPFHQHGATRVGIANRLGTRIKVGALRVGIDWGRGTALQLYRSFHGGFVSLLVKHHNDQ